jgi:hypothetical protein
MAATPRAEGVNSVEEEKDCDETLFLAFAFAMAFIHAGCGADKSTADTALPNSPTKVSPL